jgi:putative transposase
VRRTVPPSAEIEEQIDRLLAVGVGDNPRESLSELARLGARLIIQRAVENEFDAWLGRARYERRPAHQRGLHSYDSGLRNGFRARRVQTLEGELEVEIPQIREATEPFVSKLFPCSTKVLRTEPLRAMVIGAFVRGLSMRDIESLCEKAGLGKLSKTTASRICTELRERVEQFKRRDLYHVQLAALFLDAVFLPVRPNGPKEGVLVAWGFTEQGERVLLAVMLGMRESHEDWLELGRDLIARGLGAPLLIVADGAPGLIKAFEQCWPASDRQRCAVHRVRNLLAKLPERERERIRAAYWQALDDATDERDGKQRLGALVDELDGAGYTAAAKCLADDLDALAVHLRYPLRHRRRWRSTDESVKDRVASTGCRGGVSLRGGRGRPRSEVQDLGLSPAAQLAPQRALRVAPHWRRPRPPAWRPVPWPASRRPAARRCARPARRAPSRARGRP